MVIGRRYFSATRFSFLSDFFFKNNNRDDIESYLSYAFHIIQLPAMIE